MVDIRVPMRVTLDDEVDAAYIYLVDEIAPGSVARTVPLDHSGAMINLDFDSNGRVLGVEILGAAAALPTELISHLRGS